MTNVGMIDSDEGEPLVTELIAVIPQDEPEMNTSEVVDVTLDEGQERYAVRAYQEYVTKRDAGLRALRQAQADIAVAREQYVARTAWLRDAHAAAVEVRDDHERAAYLADLDRAARERDAAMAAEDAELGQRLFVKVERPARECRRYAWGDPARWRIHVKGCRYSHEVTRTNADGIRMDDACALYVGGALSCGVCKSDEMMAADPVNGEKIRAARSVRESKMVNVTQYQLKQAIKDVPWRRGVTSGLVVMSPVTFHVSSGAVVVGWRDGADKYGHAIPDDHREAVFQSAASRRGWAVAWNTQPGREGYLIVRAKTKAEIRQDKEAK